MDLHNLDSEENAALVVGIITLVSVLTRSFPDFFKKPIGHRIKPLLPVLLGLLAGVAGLCDTSMFRANTLTIRVVVGLATGAFAASGFQITKRTVAGRTSTPARARARAGSGERAEGEEESQDA